MKELKELYEKYSKRPCLCGSFEFCETCSEHSAFNKLLSEMRQKIYGQDPKISVADYGESYEIKMEDLLSDDLGWLKNPKWFSKYEQDKQ